MKQKKSKDKRRKYKDNYLIKQRKGVRKEEGIVKKSTDGLNNERVKPER